MDDEPITLIPNSLPFCETSLGGGSQRSTKDNVEDALKGACPDPNPSPTPNSSLNSLEVHLHLHLLSLRHSILEREGTYVRTQPV